MSRREATTRTNGKKPAVSDKHEGAFRIGVPGHSNPLAEVLTNAVGGMDSAPQILQSLALAYWPRAVGAQAAAATEPETVRDGILFIRTRSSVWSHELSFHKARILLTLNRMLGANVIEDIIFRAQGVKPPEEEPEPEIPPLDELHAVVLDPAEKAELRARLQALITIEDDTIRTKLASRITQDAKLRHWRLERGWRVCPRCNALHKTDYKICPMCRLSP